MVNTIFYTIYGEFGGGSWPTFMSLLLTSAGLQYGASILLGPSRCQELPQGFLRERHLTKGKGRAVQWSCFLLGAIKTSATSKVFVQYMGQFTMGLGYLWLSDHSDQLNAGNYADAQPSSQHHRCWPKCIYVWVVGRERPLVFFGNIARNIQEQHEWPDQIW